MSTTSATDAALGHRFAEALGRKDFAAAAAVFGPEMEFRALTPRRTWEASDPAGLVDEILRHWFEDGDEIDEIVSIKTDSVVDRQRVSYRFRGHNADGPFIVEQQAYYSEQDGRITWMRVLCSGFRTP